MQNIFIINPAAGKKNKKEDFISEIQQLCQRRNDCSFYITKGVSDATSYVKSVLEQNNHDIRFFACGGDGTLNEVVNGAANYSNAIVGCFPVGTGNDFVRNFDKSRLFLSIEAQLKGHICDIDLMEYTGYFNRELHHGYAANMFNIGFDCNVVDMTAKLKKCHLISGSFAYLLGVACILFQKKGAKLKIKSDNDTYCNGPLLLTTIANGCYCGGGVKSNPSARIDDGLFDLQIISDMSRITFIGLFPKYAKGTHLNVEKAKQLINYKILNEINIEALEKPMRVSIDGEIYSFDNLEIKSGTKKLRFSVPE